MKNRAKITILFIMGLFIFTGCKANESVIEKKPINTFSLTEKLTEKSQEKNLLLEEFISVQLGADPIDVDQKEIAIVFLTEGVWKVDDRSKMTIQVIEDATNSNGGLVTSTRTRGGSDLSVYQYKELFILYNFSTESVTEEEKLESGIKAGELRQTFFTMLKEAIEEIEVAEAVVEE